MTTLGRVSIVMVTYNSAEWLDSSLGTIARGVQRVPYEVIVVDNASEDDTVDQLRRRFGMATIVVNDQNEGFARAVNRGAQLASGDWILLLNPDTAVDEGAVDALVEFATAHPGHGLYGGRTITPDGAVDPSSCWGLPSVWSTTCFGLGLSTAFRKSTVFDPESLGRWPRDSVREVGFVSGSLLLIPRQVWIELDGLDERYFVYGEDADMGARAWARGYRPIVTPTATIVHAVGASSTRENKLVLLFAGKVTYIDIHFTGLGRSWSKLMLQTGVGLRSVVSAMTNRESGWSGAWHRRREWRGGFPLQSST
jgi:GT2 family glycosyltransferase